MDAHPIRRWSVAAIAFAAAFSMVAARAAAAGITIHIDSTPPGADVYVDDVSQGSWGQTPLDVPVSAGPHTLIVRLSGYQDAQKRVNVHAPVRFSFALVKASAPAPAPATPVAAPPASRPAAVAPTPVAPVAPPPAHYENSPFPPPPQYPAAPYAPTPRYPTAPYAPPPTAQYPTAPYAPTPAPYPTAPYPAAPYAPTPYAPTPYAPTPYAPVGAYHPAEAVVVKAAPPEPMPKHVWFASLWTGIGVGHPAPKTEVTNANTPGVSYTPLDIAPEIGRWITPRIGVGLLGRFQLSSGADIPASSPAALAGLARLHYWLVKGDMFDVFATLDAGGGYFRQPVTLPVEVPYGGRIDSAKSGPFLAGAGLETAFNLTDQLALAARADLLVGFGHKDTTGENVDLQLGVQARF